MDSKRRPYSALGYLIFCAYHDLSERSRRVYILRFAKEVKGAVNGVVVDHGLHRLLYEAIQNKRLVRFWYQAKERVAEPHDYGVQKGIARLLSWQIGGQSSGGLPGWRWFDVADIRDLEALDRTFAGNREVPSGQHHRWDEIFIRVAPPSRAKE